MSDIDDTALLSASEFNVRNYTSLIALLFVVADHCLLCKAEYTHIWRVSVFTRAASAVVALLYIWARYSALITLILHYTFVHVFLAKGSVTDTQCRTWFLALFGSLTSLILVLDAILFLRVYALYGKNKKTLVLVIPIIIQFVLASFTFWFVTTQSSFDYMCNFLNPKQIESVLQGVAVIFAHASLWMATFAKRNVGRGPYTLLVKLVVHEGLWAFILLFTIVGSMMPQSYASRSANPFVLFVWPISIVSVTVCRLIMNMLRLKLDTGNGDEVHLSTVIDLSQSQDSVTEVTHSVEHTAPSFDQLSLRQNGRNGSLLSVRTHQSHSIL